MPLSKLQIAPGIDKQNTEYGAEGRWVDCDNVRFRYGLPEKIGGWEKVTSDALVGATRAILTYSDLKGVKYAIYGTNKKLYAVIRKEIPEFSIKLRCQRFIVGDNKCRPLDFLDNIGHGKCFPTSCDAK